MKMSKKVLAMLLAIATLIGIFSCATTVFAEEYNEYADNKAYQEALLTEAVETEEAVSEIVCEIPEKRDEYSKTYKRADGSFTSVVSQYPIHKLKNGEWEDIDNTLKTEDNAITNADGAFDIEFPETISENEKITVNNNGESLAFSIDGIENAEGIVEENKTTQTDLIKKDLEKSISQITYENINENTNLQYIVSSNYVKENIIVSNKESLKEEYSFNIEKGELSAELDAENNLNFKNPKNEIVFTIPAPVMKDSANAVSYEIEVQIENADESVLTLSYTPSKEWLENESRVYPVIIDPVIIMESNQGAVIEDTYIGYYSENPNGVNLTGENAQLGIIADKTVVDGDSSYTIKSEVLARINMEVFNGFKQPGLTVTGVNFVADGLVQDGNLILKAIEGDWECDEITHSDIYPEGETAPAISFDEKITDYYAGSDSATAEPTLQKVFFNITELFNQWLKGERNNNGFAILPQGDAMGYLYLDGFTENTVTGKKTYSSNGIIIDYVDTNSANDSFEYLTQEIGRAGTGAVNTFGRNMSLSRFDSGMDGLRMPVSIGFNYNTSFGNFYEIVQKVFEAVNGSDPGIPHIFGKNWFPSYLYNIVQITENQMQIFTGEGTLVTFNMKEEIDSETQEASMVFEAEEASDSGYELEVINQENDIYYENVKLILPTGEAVYFNDGGFATEIQEAEPNPDGSYDKITIAYEEGSLFTIDYITDGIGRKYDFIYNSQSGLLTEIKCLAADGATIKAGTTNTDLKVIYGYNSNGYLTSVTYPDGEAVSYTYDSNGNLVKAQNIDGYNIQYTYDSLGKITNIAEYAGNTPGNTIQLTQLSNRQVKVVDGYNGTETYQFGRDGKLHYTFDEKGNYYKSEYAPAKDENVYSSSDWRITSENLLKNGSFEETSALSNTRAKYWSTGFETVNTPTQQADSKEPATFGEKVYFISSEEKCTGFVTQTVDISNTCSYTFSAFVKSENVGELTLNLVATDNSGNTDEEAKIKVNTTTDWERYSVTYTPSGDFAPEEITVGIGFEENKGTYYVDCAQLESGLGTAEYNLIENGTFTNSDEFWSASTIATDLINGKSVKAVKLSGGLPQFNVGDGFIRPEDSENIAFEDHISATTQNVEINGKKGDTFTVGGWFKGQFDDNYINPVLLTIDDSIPQQLASSSAQIKVTYSYIDTVTTTDETTNETTTTEQTLTENFVVEFCPNNNSWQYAADTFALKGDTESVDVTILAKNIPEDSFATGIELTLDNNSFSFVEEDEAEEEVTPPASTGSENTTTENTTTENTTTENTTTENTNTDNIPPTECPCEDCEELDCTCRCQSECSCVQCKRQSDIEATSEDGKTVTTSSFDGEKYMQSAVTYSDDLNNVISETDENNISSGYAYNVNGSLIEFTDGAGNKTTYGSNAMGYLTLAQSNVSGLSDNAVKMAISYVYDGDLLTKVNQGNVEYTYEYDGWGQLKKVLVDGETLVCYDYGIKEYRTRILSIVFGSSENTGFTVKYTYDINGNVTKVEKYRKVAGEKDSITYDYKYDNLGNLDYIKDNGTGHFLDYTDDGIVIKAGQNGSVIYETKDIEIPENDESSLVSITQETANGTSYNHRKYESGYSEETGKTTENEAVSVVTNGKTLGTQTLSDWFGRNEAVTVMTKDPVDTATTDFASISSQYGYVENGNVTTNLISSVTNTISGEHTNTVNYNYTYDSNGRITNASTVSSVPNLSGASQYIYDEAGQLIKEITGSTIYEYAYDSKGNISTRKVYSGETLVSTDTFTYGADTWEDRLTVYNNKTIIYDSIGNPTSYLGANLSWRGRELAGYSKGNKQISYSYDVDGMRYRKVVTEDNKTKTYDYVYSDGTLILLTYTANGVFNTARFVYDSWGEPRGFMLNDSATYLYLKNAQGDITGIVDENGEIVVRYTYNAWGAVDFVVPFGVDPSASTILATVSPFTYRGYCYDYDIGMYYLQSRYYDPEICRFINADSTEYLGATGTLLSYNLFAYCENDGVDFVDETGTTINISDNSIFDTHAKNVFRLLKKLTDDTLEYKKGKVTIKKKCAKKNIEKYYGTHLIRKLIKNKHVVEIIVDNKKLKSGFLSDKPKNRYYVYKNKTYSLGDGCDVFVNIYLKDPSIKKEKKKATPLYIILAHELIHAYRTVRGMGIDGSLVCKEHSTTKDKCWLEECFVVGLHSSNYKKHFYSIFTENNIRSEHGLVKRTYYVGW